MNLYKVGNVDVSHGYLDFSLVDELEGIDADLNDITSSEANAAIAGILAEAVEEKESGNDRKSVDRRGWAGDL